MKLIVLLFSLVAIFLVDRNTAALSSSRARREAVAYSDPDPKPVVSMLMEAVCKNQLKNFTSPDDYCQEKSHKIVRHLAQMCYKVSKKFCHAAKMWNKHISCQLWFDRTICAIFVDTADNTENKSESTENDMESKNNVTTVNLEPSIFEGLLIKKCLKPFRIVMEKRNLTDTEFNAHKFCEHAKKMFKSSCQTAVKEYVCAVFVGVESLCKLILPKLIC
ncbi:hypothetical protein TKK_0014213 [Trichogramma kaykai]